MSRNESASFGKRALCDGVFPMAIPVREQSDETTACHRISGAGAAKQWSVLMVQVIAVLCSLAPPADCNEQAVTISDFADISMQSCLMSAPQIAEWTKQHPGQRLAAWRCVVGKPLGRGA